MLFVQRHGGTENPPFCGSGAFVDEVVGVCTNHEAFHKLFNTPVSTTYPEPPAIGTVGERISSTAAFDGWGYVHLYSNTLSGGKFAELDTYAIPEAHQEAFAVGFGDLTVHEVATDPVDANRAYLSYYAGGLRSLTIQGTELVETGGYLDPLGNNFWGVETFMRDGPNDHPRERPRQRPLGVRAHGLARRSGRGPGSPGSPSYCERGSRSRFSATALSATMMLEPAIEMAPTSGRSTNPSGSKTPAATGSARLL